MAAAPDLRRLKLWQDRIQTDVEVSGKGPPLVWLHGPWGLAPDRRFVAALAENFTVHAPKFPGTSKGDPDSVHALVGWHDLVVYHGELFDKLALARPALAGHSFGALLAAEVAAATPKSVGKLALVDPVGLWRDDHPVTNWMVLPEKMRRPTLFANPDGEAAKRFFEVPTEPTARLDVLSEFVWSQACTGKFVWPIADRGFSRRAHRIAAPTLIVWGKSDKIIAPAYAQEFANRIPGAKVEMIDGAGHLPHLEQSEAVLKALRGFMAG